MFLDSIQIYLDDVALKTSHHKFADLLYRKTLFTDKDTYHQIHSKGLKSQVNLAKNDLLNKKYIERSSVNYSVGERCYQYRFSKIGLSKIRVKILNSSEEMHNNLYCKDLTRRWIFECFCGISVNRAPRVDETRLTLIENRKLWINQKNETSRVYSSITNLDRDSRDAIQLFGKDLIKLDIKSAQPFFLGRITGDERLISICVDPERDLYTFFGEILGSKSRETAKNALLQALFDADDKIYRQPTWNALRAHFPTCFHYVKEVRTYDYKALAKILETEEVKFMEKVWKILAIEKIPYLTVHDCIMILPEDEIKTREIFNFVSGKDAPVLKKEV